MAHGRPVVATRGRRPRRRRSWTASHGPARPARRRRCAARGDRAAARRRGAAGSSRRGRAREGPARAVVRRRGGSAPGTVRGGAPVRLRARAARAVGRWRFPGAEPPADAAPHPHCGGALAVAGLEGEGGVLAAARARRCCRGAADFSRRLLDRRAAATRRPRVATVSRVDARRRLDRVADAVPELASPKLLASLSAAAAPGSRRTSRTTSSAKTPLPAARGRRRGVRRAVADAARDRPAAPRAAGAGARGRRPPRAGLVAPPRRPPRPARRAGGVAALVDRRRDRGDGAGLRAAFSRPDGEPALFNYRPGCRQSPVEQLEQLGDVVAVATG